MNHHLEALNRAQAEAETDSFTPHRYRQLGQLIDGSCPRILDVGCSTGRGGVALRSRVDGGRLDGVEMLAERIARLPAGVYDTLYSVPLQEVQGDGIYDAVIMAELLEHVPFDALESSLLAALRLLRPGGSLLLTTPNPHYLLLNRRSGGSVLGGAHVSVHCATALSQYLNHLGFDVVNRRGSGRVSKLLGSRMPLFLYGSYLLKAVRPT